MQHNDSAARRPLRFLVGAALLAAAPTLLATTGASGQATANTPATLFRYPDISKDSIVFAYANDLWVVPKAGGVARPLASPPGAEAFPRFSPDGSQVAFIGNYGAGRDLHTIPTAGGVPTRVTHHPATELLTEWTADGSLLFATGEMGGLGRAQQLWRVPVGGGLPTQLPVPYGANATISKDGEWLAYTPHSIDNRTWKRYRGGMQTDIWLVNLKSGESRRITDWEGIDSLPMWKGDKVYYLSDQTSDPNAPNRLNIWVYDVKSGKREQVTRFKDFDVKWPAIGPDGDGQGEIVFQYGAKIWTLDLADRSTREVPITVPGDRPKLMPQTIDASEFIQGSSISPTGKRVAVSARGDLWTAPAESGTPRNLTRTSGVAEREPTWSPDGRWIAYFADNTGEYELYLMPSDGKGEPRKITSDGTSFRTDILWSPDSKKVVLGDKTGAIQLVDIETGTVTPIDKNPWEISMGAISWSSDSRWIAYARGSDEERAARIWIFDTTTGEKRAVTSGMFNDTNPTFDRKGDWLVFTSERSFNPKYSSLDTTWIYDESGVLVAIPLRKDMTMAWLATSDEEPVKGEKDGPKDDKKDDKKDGAEKKDEKADEKKNGAGQDAAAAVAGPTGTWTCTTEVPNMGRLEFTLVLALDADGTTVTGTMSSQAFGGSITGTWDAATKKLALTLTMGQGGSASMSLVVDGNSMKGTGTGPDGTSTTIEGTRSASAGGDAKDDDAKPKDKDAPKPVVIDFDGLEARQFQLPAANGGYGRVAFNDKNHVVYSRGGSIFSMDLSDKKREEKRIGGGGFFEMSADGKKILIGGRPPQILDANPGATPKPVVIQPMLVEIDPKAEWRQMFTEAWRLQRDYFYDPTMHGVDWKKVYEQYLPLVDELNAREDLSFLISEMISELNVGHAYYQGGDIEDSPSRSVGMLGVDFELAGEGDAKAYRIKRIVSGAPWDTDARNPLLEQGLGIEEGHFLLAVNGVPLDVRRDPWAGFQGLAGRTVTLTVGKNPVRDDTTKDVVVQALASEGQFRYRDWIEAKRRHVHEKSGGRIGYIYVPNTGVDGQTDLVRQFQGQIDRDALIIDDRWNGGGQIPHRFIEMLDRPVTNYWARRDSNDWVWPPDGHRGPKAMLINGLAGSGGDMFPWLFKHHDLGPLIGTRTWGGLVGITGGPALVDGGRVTVPSFAFYETDGTWGIEGHGVDPDIEVIDDPALMRDGGDPQLDKAIEVLLEELKTKAFVPAKRPAYPDRSGMGIAPADK
jgi:tricorn protease-like protein/C-terminal processing protease CtpA/Prc